MNDKINTEKTVGALVAEDFNRAKVFEHLGIDYCCHSDKSLDAACQEKGLRTEDVVANLEVSDVEGGAPAFATWPLDLLVDYVLKKHHRSFHLHHEELLQLVKKVERAHSERHPELHEVRQAVESSFEELDSHFAKEEQILFPQFYELYAAHEEGREPAPFPLRKRGFPHPTDDARARHHRRYLAAHHRPDGKLHDTHRRLRFLQAHESRTLQLFRESERAYISGEQPHLPWIHQAGTSIVRLSEEQENTDFKNLYSQRPSVLPRERKPQRANCI